jgi:hypothetical protein
VPGYDLVEDLEIAAICDIQQKRIDSFKEKFNMPDVPAFTDYRDLLKVEGLDFVDICTPNKMHSIIAVDALESGLHVWDYEEATEEHGVTCTVCGYVLEGELEHVHACETIFVGSKASCTENGIITHYICQCGIKFYDKKCTEIVVNDSDLIIPATGHSPLETPKQEPTCTSVGYTAGVICETCRVWIEERSTITMLEHSFVDGECENCGSIDESFKPDNVITVFCEIDAENDRAVVRVNVESIKMAGILFTLNTNGYILEETATAPEEAVYYAVDGVMKYTVAQGFNFDHEEMELITFELVTEDAEASPEIMLEVNEIYFFTEDGEIVVPTYKTVVKYN